MLLMPGVVKKTTNLVHLDDHRCWQWGTNDLEALIDNLASVDHVTEQSFLELGSRIRLFHGQAQGISCVAGEVVQLLHGNDIENTLQHLQLLVERCSLWLSETGEKSTEICALLNSVMTQITDLDAAVDGLRKVTKTLHALRVSTRIEAAKGYASGAGVLARSLDELGRLVSEKITEIFERTELLVPMINQSLTMERAAQSGSIRTAHCEVKKARDLLTAFLTLPANALIIFKRPSSVLVNTLRSSLFLRIPAVMKKLRDSLVAFAGCNMVNSLSPGRSFSPLRTISLKICMAWRQVLFPWLQIQESSPDRQMSAVITVLLLSWMF
jgi:hypothetical protein